MMSSSLRSIPWMSTPPRRTPGWELANRIMPLSAASRTSRGPAGPAVSATNNDYCAEAVEAELKAKLDAAERDLVALCEKAEQGRCRGLLGSTSNGCVQCVSSAQQPCQLGSADHGGSWVWALPMRVATTGAHINDDMRVVRNESARAPARSPSGGMVA